MDHRTIPDFMRAIAPVIRDYVGELLRPFLARLTAIETRELPAGPQGNPGSEGRGFTAALIDADGMLVLTMSDGAVLRLARVTGRDGADGRDGAPGTGIDGVVLENGALRFLLTDGRSLEAGLIVGRDGIPGDRGEPGERGERGLPGRDIREAIVTEGRLLVIYSDGTELDAGEVRGEPGSAGPQGEPGEPGAAGLAGERGTDGRSVREVCVIDDSLLVVYTDGTEANAGEVRGPAGRSVDAAEIRSGNLIVRLSDGAEHDLGPVTGQDGRAGEQGPPGEAGPQGASGPAGIQYAAVIDDDLVLTLSDQTTLDVGRIVGKAGEAGIAGADGEPGPEGPPGPPGEPGEPGPSGEAGSQGPQGEAGVAGAQGRDGQDGADGVGLADATLVDGTLVLALSDGTTRSLGYVVGSNGADGQPGPQGEPGLPGEKGIAGEPGPAGMNGTAGDSIMAAEVDAAGDLVLSLTDGEVLKVGRVVGRDGIDGKDGAPGEAGPTGAQGNDGTSISTAAIDSDGELVLSMDSGDIVKVGRVIGRDGLDGKDGAPGAALNDSALIEMQTTLATLSAEIKALREAPSARTIFRALLDADDNLVVIYSDGASDNLGCIRGADAVSVSGLEVDAAGSLITTLSDGRSLNAGRVRGLDGKDGADGRDGMGFDDASLDYDGERTLTFRLTRGDVTVEHPVAIETLLYRGIWRAGPYVRGDVVTYAGCVWIASRATDDKPGIGHDSETDWSMAVKSGRDGKSAYDLARLNGYTGSAGDWLLTLRGPEGKEGRPGRDGLRPR